MRKLLLAGLALGALSFSLPASAASVATAITAVGGAQREIPEFMAMGSTGTIQIDRITQGSQSAFDTMVTRNPWAIQKAQAAVTASPAAVQALGASGLAIADVVALSVNGNDAIIYTR
jgi:hypothetical protein